MAGAYKTGKYRNIFKEYGYPEEEIQKRVEDTFNTIFYGNDDERFYHEAGDDMGYMEDTGNHDVRTEGMSYGMMVCVQLDKKAEFDRLWKWVRTYMYIEDGPAKNYFAWSCQTNGKRNADGPAPDGEEYFAMALFFASKRWGDGDGIFCYSKEAQNILRECVHKDNWDGVFLIDGTPLDEKALHPVAIIAVNAEASLAADGKYAKQCVEKFWNTPLRTGDRRYYDNFLYMFAMLALSGNYRIY